VHAEIARSFLDAEGIRAFVADGEVVNTAWILSGAVGGIKLKVARSDFLAAERLLHAQRSKQGGALRDDYGLPLPSDAITKDRPRKSVRRDAITADPASTTAPDEAEDADETEPADQAHSVDSLLTKAMIVGVLGTFICPVVSQAYSLHLLSQAQESSGRLTSRQNFFLRAMQVFNGLVLVAALTLTVVFWSSRFGF
jgi:hypothetical protein